MIFCSEMEQVTQLLLLAIIISHSCFCLALIILLAMLTTHANWAVFNWQISKPGYYVERENTLHKTENTLNKTEIHSLRDTAVTVPRYLKLGLHYFHRLLISCYWNAWFFLFSTVKHEFFLLSNTSSSSSTLILQLRWQTISWNSSHTHTHSG